MQPPFWSEGERVREVLRIVVKGIDIHAYDRAARNQDQSSCSFIYMILGMPKACLPLT